MRLKGETLLASVGRDGACWAVRVRMRLLSREAPWQKQAWDLIGTVIHPNIPPPPAPRDLPGPCQAQDGAPHGLPSRP